MFVPVHYCTHYFQEEFQYVYDPAIFIVPSEDYNMVVLFIVIKDEEKYDLKSASSILSSLCIR